MDLSVIIPAFNRPKSLLMLVGMLKRQRGAGLEIIVCDDGSHPPVFPVGRVDCYLWRPDTGYHATRAINEGVLLSRGQAVAILGDDCLVRTEDWAKAHLAVLRESEISRGPFELVDLDDNLVPVAKHPDIFGVPGTYFSTVNVAFRRQTFFEIGGLDDRYDGAYGQMDLDLALKIRKMGYSVGNAGQKASVFHVGKPYGTDENHFRSASVMEKNIRLVEEKWGRPLSELKRMGSF